MTSRWLKTRQNFKSGLNVGLENLFNDDSQKFSLNSTAIIFRSRTSDPFVKESFITKVCLGI